MTRYYQILDSSYEVKGTYEKFETALENKSEGDTIRYFDGSI